MSAVKYFVSLEGSDGKKYRSNEEYNALLRRLHDVEFYTQLLKEKFKNLEAPKRRDDAVKILRRYGRPRSMRWLTGEADINYLDVRVLVEEGRVVEVKHGNVYMVALPEWDTGPQIEYEPPPPKK